MKRSLYFILFLWSLSAFPQSLLSTVERLYFDPLLAPRVGLETELAGLNTAEVAHISQKILSGSVVVHERIESQENKNTGTLKHFRVKERELVDSRIGSLIIKPEDNSTDNSNLKENYANTRVVELVTAPVYFPEVVLFQSVLDEVHAQGALGTAVGFPVSIQVNVEMGEGDREKIKVKDVLNILRNYLKPEHRKQIAAELDVPHFRKKFLGLYSPGMMARILDSNYLPSWEDFFVDFMYRQSLEILSYKNAWSLSESQVRAILKDELKTKGFEVILPVIKWNYIRVSSLFMFMFPEDWLTKFLEETTWFHKYPILEFREPNNNFDALGTTRKILGLVQASLKVGEFDFPQYQTKHSETESLCWRLLMGISVQP